MPASFVGQLERAAGVMPVRFLAGPEANGGILGMLAPLVSHMALHAGLMHIFFNCVWLLAMGTPVALRLGAGAPNNGLLPSSLFLSFFVLSGVAGALFYVGLNTKSFALLVGASGGISGLLGALLRILLRPRPHFARPNNDLVPLTDRNLLIWTVLILIFNVVFAFYGSPVGAQQSNIAWEAHMGGFLFGLLTFPIFDNFARRYSRNG